MGSRRSETTCPEDSIGTEIDRKDNTIIFRVTRYLWLIVPQNPESNLRRRAPEATQMECAITVGNVLRWTSL
jgi:hypothetical protein